jgi:hypothetical protein
VTDTPPPARPRLGGAPGDQPRHMADWYWADEADAYMDHLEAKIAAIEAFIAEHEGKMQAAKQWAAEIKAAVKDLEELGNPEDLVRSLAEAHEADREAFARRVAMLAVKPYATGTWNGTDAPEVVVARAIAAAKEDK